MTKSDLKYHIYHLVDATEDDEVLESVLKLLGSQNSDALHWDNLSNADKQEIIAAYESSLDQANLSTHNEVLKRLQ